ncbi:potassium-transporting ATPase subunit KdpC [Chelatococcus sp. SYSU_G07232]|uniref:Potassium-transporting ATPase KdpC subunit n=1 Tax=Chelatococcus albus TaxID=3047466 RepID=A0ABT7AD69_9HYPH|nr:potassium-transporting ATPase subunit KdpC [Chelatococcus sp. SYSU_G07232]MDJ1157325.1 potassium-transporting ATPase subunit KdpC [Chelatococcus sp. SYSU_G07232]
MIAHLRPALTLVLMLTAVTGIAYPLAVTGVAQAVFPGAANGSLVTDGKGTVVGSALIGQAFSGERYFHPRPSATTGADPADPSKTVYAPYNAAASTGSNLGPTSTRLVERVRADAERLTAETGARLLPADAVTASGSGLDPHISPAHALLQASRVARARGLPVDRVEALVAAHTEGRTFGILGEPRVNVLLLNRALDALPSG